MCVKHESWGPRPWGLGPSPSWCVVVEGLDVQQLSTPCAPSCSNPCAAVHTWSTTALHTGIFHFLFSVTLFHSSPPLCSFPQTKSKTSGALQHGGWRQRHPHQPVRHQHAWHFKPNPMTQLLWRELRITSLLLLKLGEWGDCTMSCTICLLWYDTDIEWLKNKQCCKQQLQTILIPILVQFWTDISCSLIRIHAAEMDHKSTTSSAWWVAHILWR